MEIVAISFLFPSFNGNEKKMSEIFDICVE